MLMNGSGICTTPMCSAGSASIAEMDSVYQSLPASLQSVYQSSHDAIMSTYGTYSYNLDQWIPFNPACCSLQELGTQADQLASQMQTASGSVQLGQGPGTQATPTGLLNLFGSNVLWIGLAAVAGMFLLAKEKL